LARFDSVPQVLGIIVGTIQPREGKMWQVVALDEAGEVRRTYGGHGMSEDDARKLCDEKTRRYPRLAFEVVFRDRGER
jgi:hypothetical protein